MSPSSVDAYAYTEDGFFDLQCQCGATDLIIQCHEDAVTIKIHCFKCKREIAFQVENYLEALSSNNFRRKE